MTVHEVIMPVPAHVIAAMEQLCRVPPGACREVEFDEEVRFPDGRRMAVQVCGTLSPATEPCWTQGVVFSPEGHELGCTDVGESFAGEYDVCVGSQQYRVVVVAD